MTHTHTSRREKIEKKNRRRRIPFYVYPVRVLPLRVASRGLCVSVGYLVARKELRGYRVRTRAEEKEDGKEKTTDQGKNPIRNSITIKQMTRTTPPPLPVSEISGIGLS